VFKDSAKTCCKYYTEISCDFWEMQFSLRTTFLSKCYCIADWPTAQIIHCISALAISTLQFDETW